MTCDNNSVKVTVELTEKTRTVKTRCGGQLSTTEFNTISGVNSLNDHETLDDSL